MVTPIYRGRPCSGLSPDSVWFTQDCVRGSNDMASAKFEREYSQHLVEQVLKGKMTRRQMLVRASVFGLSLTAAGQLLAACGGDDGGTEASPSASGAPEPVIGGNLKWIGP